MPELKLSKADKEVSPKKLLCNWPKCTSKNGKKAPAQRLCPYCHCVAYCCKFCLESDIKRHIRKECQKNIKMPMYI